MSKEDKEELFVKSVAALLDRPSIYMEGPSKRNLRVAYSIWTMLKENGWELHPNEDCEPQKKIMDEMIAWLEFLPAPSPEDVEMVRDLVSRARSLSSQPQKGKSE